MAAGEAPISAYRTLDLPALGSLTALAGSIPYRPGVVAETLDGARILGHLLDLVRGNAVTSKVRFVCLVPFEAVCLCWMHAAAGLPSQSMIASRRKTT